MDERTKTRLIAFMYMLETLDKKKFERCYNYLIAIPGKSSEQKHDARRCCTKVFARKPRDYYLCH